LLKDNESKAFRTLAYKQASVKDVLDKMEMVRNDIGGFHPYIIALVDTKLDGAKFSNVFGSHRAENGVAVFTIANIDDTIFPNEKIAAYMLYYFARYTLSFIVPQHKNHNETKDCVFDRKIYKPDVVRSMKAGAICDECRDQLLSGDVKLSPAQLDALDLLIELSGKLLNGSVVISTKIRPTNDFDPLTELLEIKNRLDANAHKSARNGLWSYFFALFGALAILAILTYQFGWNVMEPWTYFIGGLLTIGGYVYFVVTQKEFSPRTIYDQVVESKKRKNYTQFGLDVDKIERLLEAKNRSEPKP